MHRNWCAWGAPLLGLGAAFAAIGPASARAATPDFMFRAQVEGRVLEGRPIHWSDSWMALLGRDGQLHEFDPREAREAKRTAPRYAPYPLNELRRRLLEEFPNRYEATSTGHYLVVHPEGESGVWPGRFEEIYRSVGSYLRVRGFSTEEPAYPLIAVVFRTQAEYEQHLRDTDARVLPDSLGCYSHKTNRVCLFDLSRAADDADWSPNTATIVHEATHQVAFNLGVHSRTSPPPYWVPEGLATMFESPAVLRPGAGDRREDRVQALYLAEFRRKARGEKPPFSLASFLASDEAFKQDGPAAYAQAWALTYYLSETQPSAYCGLLADTANKPAYSEFSAAERLRLFRQRFGEDLAILEANLMRWVARL